MSQLTPTKKKKSSIQNHPTKKINIMVMIF